MGLLGELLRPMAGRLVGVDLSPRMVEKAGERGLYDELIVGDVVTWPPDRGVPPYGSGRRVRLPGRPRAGVPGGRRGEVRPGGLFAFSVESLDGAAAEEAGYRLGPSRRYAHCPLCSAPVASGTG